MYEHSTSVPTHLENQGKLGNLKLFFPKSGNQGKEAITPIPGTRSLICINRLPYFSLSSTTMGLEYSSSFRSMEEHYLFFFKEYSTPAGPSLCYSCQVHAGSKGCNRY